MHQKIGLRDEKQCSVQNVATELISIYSPWAGEE